MLRILLFCVLLLGGCRNTAPSANPPPAPPRVFLQHLPGVGGTRIVDVRMIEGLKEAGLDAEMHIYDWTHGDIGLPALAGYDRNRAEARKIAGRLAERYRGEPGLRLYLTGHSGGGGMTVWVLEELPEDVTVEAVLLLAPALSPEYDLSPALRRVRGHMYHFHSEYDWIVGRGTRHFGTLDRVFTHSAGNLGFAMPEGADARQYEKLVQFPYDRDWMRYGNFGEHIGMMTTPFAREFLAPLLIREGMPAEVR